MAETLIATINRSGTANLSQPLPLGGTTTAAYTETLLGASLTSGTGADKGNQFYSLTQILGPAEAWKFNVHNGAQNLLTATVLDALGNAVNFASIKDIVIRILGNTGCQYVASATVHSGGGGSGYTNGAQVITLAGGSYLGSVVIHSGGGGSSYVVGDVLTIAGGTGTAATVQVLTVSGGAILTLAVLTRGAYSANPTTSNNSPTGGTGSGAGLDLTMIASIPAQLNVTVAGNAVTAVNSVAVLGSYVVAPPTSACPAASGGGGTGATFDLTLGTYVIGSPGAGQALAVYSEADYLTVGALGSSAQWTALLTPNTASMVMNSGTNNLPGYFERCDGGSTGSAGLLVGTSTTNNILYVVNGGSNPVAFEIVLIGANA
jgi:hypothetical protein